MINNLYCQETKQRNLCFAELLPKYIFSLGEMNDMPLTFYLHADPSGSDFSLRLTMMSMTTGIKLSFKANKARPKVLNKQAGNQKS